MGLSASKFRKINITPDEAGTLDAIRKNGHSVFDSLNELIDNSLDAKATEVKVKSVYSNLLNSKKNKISSLLIADNGHGIAHFEQALKIGDREAKTDAYKTGKFKIGLKAAIFSLGSKVTLLTKTLSGDLEVCVWDLNDNKREQWGLFISNEAPEGLKKRFSEMCGETGTLILIEEVLNEASHEIQKVDEMKLAIGRCYNRFILKQKAKIEFNGAKVQAQSIVPKNHHILLNENLKAISNVNVRLIELKTDATAKDRGVYVFLNDRLLTINPIQRDEFTFNHPEYNHLRLEINIPSWNEVIPSKGLNIYNQKNKVHISGAVLDEIRELIYPSVQDYKKRLDEQRQLEINAELLSTKFRVISSSKEEKKEDPAQSQVLKELEELKAIKNKMQRTWEAINKHFNLKEGTVLKNEDVKSFLETKPSQDFIKEMRLLNYLNTLTLLPKSLTDKNITPFPLTNDTIVFVRASEVFLKLGPLNKENIKHIYLSKLSIPKLEVLTLDKITSEAKALKFCKYYGIINEAVGDDSVLTEVVGGRERLNKISLNIGGKVIEPEGVQFEVDCGYEGKDLYLIEAKMASDEREDISIRQLALPHKHFMDELKNSKKSVKSYVFIWYKKENIARIIPVLIDTEKGQYLVDNKNEKIFKFHK